ncbi:hypothetical protein BDN67DRAFT_100982 [Paxillus ammoniavirescens]|nr:hypothetical protein BDN67DRAFT_100982 [Paxillus ammoniavirescens]
MTRESLFAMDPSILDLRLLLFPISCLLHLAFFHTRITFMFPPPTRPFLYGTITYRSPVPYDVRSLVQMQAMRTIRVGYILILLICSKNILWIPLSICISFNLHVHLYLWPSLQRFAAELRVCNCLGVISNRRQFHDEKCYLDPRTRASIAGALTMMP